MTRPAIRPVRPSNATAHPHAGIRRWPTPARRRPAHYAGVCLLCTCALLALGGAVATAAFASASSATHPTVAPLLRIVLVGGLAVPVALSR